MKKIILILAFITLANAAFAQYIGIPEDTKKEIQYNHLILGFINPKNLSWTNSFSMSYASFGGSSYALTSYTGTLGYKIRNNMNISADITMQYAPYANLGTNSISDNKLFQNYLSGVNLSRVSFNWQPFKNMFVNLQYFNTKSSNYYNSLENYYFPSFIGY